MADFVTLGAIITIVSHVWEAVDQMKDAKLGMEHLAKHLKAAQGILREAQHCLSKMELESFVIQDSMQGIEEALHGCKRVVDKIRTKGKIARFFLADELLMSVKTSGLNLARSLENFQAHLDLRNRADLRNLHSQFTDLCQELKNVRLDQLKAMNEQRAQMRRDLEVYGGGSLQVFQETMQKHLISAGCQVTGAQDVEDLRAEMDLLRADKQSIEEEYLARVIAALQLAEGGANAGSSDGASSSSAAASGGSSSGGDSSSSSGGAADSPALSVCMSAESAAADGVEAARVPSGPEDALPATKAMATAAKAPSAPPTPAANVPAASALHFRVASSTDEIRLLKIIKQERIPDLDEYVLEEVLYIVNDHRSVLLARDESGYTALHLACMRGRGNVVAKLLAFQDFVEVDAATQDGLTPLMLACAGGLSDIVEMLLESKADVERENSEGWRAAHFASFGGHGGIVQLLCEKGANMAAQTRTTRTGIPAGSTPRDISKKLKRNEGNGS